MFLAGGRAITFRRLTGNCTFAPVCMTLTYRNKKTHAELHLVVGEVVTGNTRSKKILTRFYTVAWNTGADQTVTIDQIEYSFPAGCILSLTAANVFHFENPEQIAVWRFNREFYCIADHDKEVGCLGILFYGSAGQTMINLDPTHRQKVDLLMRVFIDEFNTIDSIQEEMLQMLLKRLIIILTRLIKNKYLDNAGWTDEKMDIVRRYNILVEEHFREQHQVQFYAAKLNKSPKTLANHFAVYNNMSPIAVIHERLILEAKRLLMYTDKTGKEIAYTLGFEDTAYFSKFFKHHTSRSISDFKREKYRSIQQ